MRVAEQRPEPKIHPALHVDVVVRGRRITDETFNRRRHVSVGRSRDNAIVLFDAHAPRSLPLFHRSRAGYDLHYTDELHGRVARSSEAPWSDLSQLHEASSTRRHGYDLPLSEGARGEIELGDETLEFQLVPGIQPLVVPRRWSGRMALGAALLLGGLLAWALVGRTPPPPPAQRAVAAAPLPVATPIATPVTALPRLTLSAHRPGRVASRTARHRADIGPTGTLQAGAALPSPKIDSVAVPPHEAELSAGPSDYTSDGVLRPEAVVRLLDQEKGAVRAIYERALRQSPTLEGDMVVRVLVNTDGSVGRVTVVTDTLPSVEMSRRVTRLLRDWHAPGATLAPAEYEVPFHFRAVKLRH